MNGSHFRELCEEVLAVYPRAVQSDLTNHPAAKLMSHELAGALRDGFDVADYKVKGSAGGGNWAETPWVAVFDRRITTTARKGFYVVYLFRSDGSCAYLSLNQGTTEARELHGAKYRAALSARARKWADWLGPQEGFAGGPIDLEARGALSRGYESGNVFGKKYVRGQLPSGPALERDLQDVMAIYKRLADKGGVAP